MGLCNKPQQKQSSRNQFVQQPQILSPLDKFVSQQSVNPQTVYIQQPVQQAQPAPFDYNRKDFGAPDAHFRSDYQKTQDKFYNGFLMQKNGQQQAGIPQYQQPQFPGGIGNINQNQQTNQMVNPYISQIGPIGGLNLTAVTNLGSSHVGQIINQKQDFQIDQRTNQYYDQSVKTTHKGDINIGNIKNIGYQDKSTKNIDQRNQTFQNNCQSNTYMNDVGNNKTFQNCGNNINMQNVGNNENYQNCGNNINMQNVGNNTNYQNSGNNTNMQNVGNNTYQQNSGNNSNMQNAGNTAYAVAAN